MTDLGEGPRGAALRPILGKKGKKSQKEEQPAGQAKQSRTLPLAQGLDPPLGVVR